MKLYIKTAVIMVLAALVSCGQRTGQGSDDAAQKKTRAFPMVNPPAMMQDQMEILEYMSVHYWDAFAAQPKDGGKPYLCDSMHVSGVEKGAFEQALANYIYILENLPLRTAQKGVRKMAEKAEACETADTASNIFETFVEMAEKYMFDPNSPLRNEDLYSPFASSLSQSAHLDSATRDRYAYVAGMCRLNEKGTKAADFLFSDKNGRQYTLYGIKADFTLLFFSNPGCHSCLDIINALKDSPQISEMISDGKMAVLNIYIDEDLQAWREYMPIYPEQWYNGFDPDLVIRTDKVYNVRAIPSLYLLDSEKTVLLKDADLERLFAVMQNLKL
jgi:hypothetical protein